MTTFGSMSPLPGLLAPAIEKNPYLVNIHICSVLLNPLDR